MTLEEAQDFLIERFEEGADCPCCGQYVKLYKRKITSSMAVGLLVLSRKQHEEGREEWIHIPTLFSEHRVCSDNMGSLLRLWGLIEGQPGERDDGSWRVGFYRMTDLGCAFVEGKVTVPKYIYLYNQMVIRRGADADPARVSIYEALGEKFDYTELMNATPEAR